MIRLASPVERYDRRISSYVLTENMRGVVLLSYSFHPHIVSILTTASDTSNNTNDDQLTTH